jgi:DNA-binding FadR family transcriptional regulator
MNDLAETFPRKRGRPLVQDTAERLRDLVFAEAPEARIGALPELAAALGVGIVTVQQAARVLEHEGLLEVRRGPGGGYYGKRPDAAALERSLGAYMRMHPASFAEALDMTSLLFTELATAAAGANADGCREPGLKGELEGLQATIDECGDEQAFGAFEVEFQDLLFRMVDRPLFELLTRVVLGLAQNRPGVGVFGAGGGAPWREGRHRIIAAILAGDADLARFEADRSNRRLVRDMLRQQEQAG